MNPYNPDGIKLKKFRRYYTALDPMWQKPKNRIYTTIIFSFLAISLFGWFAIRPTIQTILLLQREIQDKQHVNIQMEEKIADLIEARTQLDLIVNKLYLISDAIPQTTQPIDLSLQLRNMISSNQTDMQTLSIGKVPIAENDGNTKLENALKSTEFTINTSLINGYPQLENILIGLNNMRRLVTVRSMNFSQETDSGSNSESSMTVPVKLSLQLEAYNK